MTEKVYIDPENIDFSLIRKAADLIKQGGIVAVPTETVYGLAVNLKMQASVNRLFELKKRPQEKNFTLHIPDESDVDFYLEVLPPYGYRLIEKFWPGPLTVIFYSKIIPGTLGARVPNHKVCREILKETFTPVIISSANISGLPAAVNSQQAEEYFPEGLDLIVDSGPCQYKTASTVLDLTQHPAKIIREGALPKKDIWSIIRKKRVLFVCTGNSCRSVMAEYLLKLYISRDSFLSEDIEVESAGTLALPGSSVSEETIFLLKQEGIDASGHRARRITREIVHTADIIIVMEQKHKESIAAIEPKAFSRITHISSFLPDLPDRDIPDPIGGSEDVYRQSFAVIKTAVQNIADWLKE